MGLSKSSQVACAFCLLTEFIRVKMGRRRGGGGYKVKVSESLKEATIMNLEMIEKSKWLHCTECHF